MNKSTPLLVNFHVIDVLFISNFANIYRSYFHLKKKRLMFLLTSSAKLQNITGILYQFQIHITEKSHSTVWIQNSCFRTEGVL